MGRGSAQSPTRVGLRPHVRTPTQAPLRLHSSAVCPLERTPARSRRSRGGSGPRPRATGAGREMPRQSVSLRHHRMPSPRPTARAPGPPRLRMDTRARSTAGGSRNGGESPGSRRQRSPCGAGAGSVARKRLATRFGSSTRSLRIHPDENLGPPARARKCATEVRVARTACHDRRPNPQRPAQSSPHERRTGQDPRAQATHCRRPASPSRSTAARNERGLSVG